MLEEIHRDILTELSCIPAELCSSGMLRTGRDTVKKEAGVDEEGERQEFVAIGERGNVMEQEDGSIINEEVGEVAIKEERDMF